jgi:hypothetical protein
VSRQPPSSEDVRQSLEILQTAMANHATGTAGRWSTNAVNSIMFRGTSVGLSTLVRELTGQATIQALTHAPEELKLAAAGTLVGAAILSNLADLALRRRSGAASSENLFAGLASTGALAASVALLGKTKLAAAAPLLVKAGIYSAARGGLDQVLSMRSSGAGSVMSNEELLVHGVAYGVNQFFVNIGQRLGGIAGTSLTAENETALAALRGGLVAYSAVNAAGEAIDYLADKAIATFLRAVRENPERGSGGWQRGLDDVARVEITGQLRVPQDRPTQTLLGPMTGRFTSLAVLYLLLAKLGHLSPEDTFSPSVNGFAADLIGALVFSFMTKLNDARTAPPRLRPPAQRDIEMGDV